MIGQVRSVGDSDYSTRKYSAKGEKKISFEVYDEQKEREGGIAYDPGIADEPEAGGVKVLGIVKKGTEVEVGVGVETDEGAEVLLLAEEDD